MMVPAPATALATSPYASGVTTAALHPALPQLDAAYAAAAAANLQPPAKDTTWTKLFVGGLPYTTTDQELREFFEEFGEIEEAAVIIDRQTGKSKGYGFVTMADTKAAARAVQNPNPVIQGRKSNVNYAFIGAKHNSPRAGTVQPASHEDQSYYVMTPEAYASAAATMHRYQTFLPPQYGAKGALRTKIMRGPGAAALAHRPLAAAPYRASAAAGAMLYSAAPYSTVLPAAATAVPVPAAAASAAQAVLPGGALCTSVRPHAPTTGLPCAAYWYGAPTAYDYGLTVPSSAVTAASQLPPQYFYQQMMDPSQYMTMASLQGTPLTSATHGAGTTVMPSMYQSIGPSVSVSAAVTSATPALPAPTPTALPAASYPAIQDQR